MGPVVFYSSTLYISAAVSQHQLLHILQIQRQKMFFMWGLFFQMLHRRNWTRETEPFWFKPVKRYQSASVLNNVTTVHYACIQTTELRRIKRMWVQNICLSVCVCFSGKNKTTRCMRGTSTVATTVQTSSCVQMASLCGNEQLGERSGLHPRQLPTAETSSGKNKQSFLLLPVKVICAAGRLWRVKGCSHMKTEIFYTQNDFKHTFCSGWIWPC